MSSSRKITVANGQAIPIVGQGNVCLNPSLLAQQVLYVPSLSTNLLSVHKLAQSLNCCVIFSPHDCVFQDLATRKIIGTAKALNGLYYLQGSSEPPVGDQSILNYSSSLLTSTRSNIWLQHFRLGHPHFLLLKFMFPNVFKGVDITDFHCDVCELSKHHRVPYVISNKLSLSPFSLVHFDVWGPSRVPNCSGVK